MRWLLAVVLLVSAVRCSADTSIVQKWYKNGYYTYVSVPRSNGKGFITVSKWIPPEYHVTTWRSTDNKLADYLITLESYSKVTVGEKINGR